MRLGDLLIRELMLWSYPGLAASTFLLAVLAYLVSQNHGFVERKSPTLFFVYRCAELTSYALLAQAASSADMDALRPWIVGMRLIMLALSLLINIYLLRVVLRHYREE